MVVLITDTALDLLLKYTTSFIVHHVQIYQSDTNINKIGDNSIFWSMVLIFEVLVNVTCVSVCFCSFCFLYLFYEIVLKSGTFMIKKGLGVDEYVSFALVIQRVLLNKVFTSRYWPFLRHIINEWLLLLFFYMVLWMLGFE